MRVNVLEGTYNGMRALPAQPSDATQPIDPDWISTGKTSTMTMIRMGQNGERKNPRIEKATAERIRLGMTQMMTSSAIEMSVLRMSYRRPGAAKVGDADCGHLQDDDHVVLSHVVCDGYQDKTTDRDA